MTDEAIVVEGLKKSYGAVEALAGVDFAAPTGTVLGLLGPNGAGKTTAVRILATLLKADGGSARVAGLDVAREAAALRAKIGLAGQYAAVDENLTGFENLEMVGRLYHLGKAESRRRAGQRLRRREAREEALVVRHDPLRLRLLEHHLRDEDRPRVAREAPRQRPAHGLVPVQQRFTGHVRRP